MSEKPNVSSFALKEVARQALKEDEYLNVDVDKLVAMLSMAGVFRALEEHIEREMAHPSLKGPGKYWTRRRSWWWRLLWG